MNVLAPTIPIGQKGSDGVTRFEFESVSHALELAGAKGVGAHAGSARLADQLLAEKGGTAWVNRATIDSLLRDMASPPSALIVAVELMRDRLASLVESPTRKRRRLVRNEEHGDELDPLAVLNRRTDGWTRIESARVPKHVVTVAVNNAVSSICSQQHLIYRGAAMVAMVDMLSASGHSVEVAALSASSGMSPSTRAGLMTRVPVKAANQPLDIGTLCVCLAEIGFARMVVMPIEARCAPEQIFEHFGCPMRIPEQDRKDFDLVLDADVFTEEKAVAVVAETVRRFNA